MPQVSFVEMYDTVKFVLSVNFIFKIALNNTFRFFIYDTGFILFE